MLLILAVKIEIASITPPIGMNLFVTSPISRTPLEQVVRGVLPFVAVLGAGLLMITYLPRPFLLAP